MTTRRLALWLLAIQLAIVCSIAGKYLYERATCPRVWAEVQPYDPEMFLRGRYYAFTVSVDACGLPRDKESFQRYDYYASAVHTVPTSTWNWRVTTSARDGKLAVTDARKVLPTSGTSTVTLIDGSPCAKARLTPPIDLFVPESAGVDLPRPNQGNIWLEVTVPPTGPPRAIQMATNINGNWKVLSLR